MSRKKVLVVDDDAKVVEVLKLYLNHAGCEVITAYTGTEGLRLAREAHPDLVVLDLMLPELDGFEVCRALRSESGMAIIMLTARTMEQDRIAGLDLGADDYVSKPFSPRELAARVRAVLRRMPDSFLERGPDEITCGEITICFSKHEAFSDNDPLDLTPTEFRLLGVMMRSAGRVFSRSELINQVFDYECDSFEHTVDTHIMNLRRKLEPDPGKPRYILTVFGAGYKFARGDEE